MKISRILIALVCLGLALGGCASKQAEEAPAPAAAQPSAPVVEVTANSLNVRAAASATGAVVGTLKRGERANAPNAAEGGWLYVESETGLKGYVASQYVRTLEAAPAAAPASAAEPAAKSEPAPAKSTGRPAPSGS
jgi:uncharacterized protein YgiM (DUF1202 family)